MMTFDTKVPENLKNRQQWFGSIISVPLDNQSEIHPISPTGRPTAEEVSDHIAPSPTLKPIERMQIYNQQYWWRLLNTLHEEFPLLTRLFGYKQFNDQIAVPYLVTHPSNHWSLEFLGNRVVQWLTDHYHENDKPFILDAAVLDWAYNEAFIAGHLTPFGEGIGIESLMNQTVFFQPHLHLFSFDYDLFQLREDFLTHDPDYWEINEFPELKKERAYYFVFYRNDDNDLMNEEIPKEEWLLLDHFTKGCSIEEMLHWLEDQEDTLKNEISQNLDQWIQKWIYKQWLTSKSLG